MTYNFVNNLSQYNPSLLHSIHLLISTLISCVGILMASCWPDDKKCTAYFVMLYLRGAFWFVTLILHNSTAKQHETLQLYGYHDFHKETSAHRNAPIYVVSLWNSTILIVQALMQQVCIFFLRVNFVLLFILLWNFQAYGNGFGEACIATILSPVIYITLFNISENIVLAGVNGSYICKFTLYYVYEISC